MASIFHDGLPRFGDKRRRERTSLQKNPSVEEIGQFFYTVGGYKKANSGPL